MNSSYNNNVTFGDVLDSVVFSLNPKKIVEVGILEGFSLKRFAESSNADIQAYDIFDKFNGNHAKKDELVSTFEKYNNVTINYGDFYEVHNIISDWTAASGNNGMKGNFYSPSLYLDAGSAPSCNESHPITCIAF